MPPSPAPLSSPVNSAHPRRPPPLPPVSRKINGGIREFSMGGGGKGKFTERRNSREGETQWTSLWLNGEKSPRGPRPSLTFPLSSIESNRVEFRSAVVIICSFYRYFFGLFSKIFRGDKLFTLETGALDLIRDIGGGEFWNFLFLRKDILYFRL